MKIIGITGKINSGKTTIAHILRNKGYIQTSFANKLKEIVSDIFDIPLEKLYDQNGKNEVQDYWGMTGREIMQKFGTEAMRHTFGDDFWIKIFEKHLDHIQYQYGPDAKVVIDDVRFPSEAEFVYSRKGQIWEVQRGNIQPRYVETILCKLGLLHESEKRLPSYYIDVTIGNNDTIHVLKNNILSLI